MTGTRQTTPGGRHRAGVPTPPRGSRSPRLSQRTGRVLLAGGLAVASVTGGFVVAQTASAAVPTFPNNVVVFPDRDFVTIEGYQDHIGDTALVEVTRGGTVVGSAQGKVVEGDVAFEINHPGGYCWGAGTGINVTPDIKAGDVVSIRFDGALAGETTTADAAATVHAVRNDNTVTVTGKIAAGVIRAQTEQRIINPDLVTGGAVGRRDVRALPGPLTPSDKGGYSSGLAFSGDTFTATYVFDVQSDAVKAAAAGGERLMSWQEEDGDGNRQGLTIAEFGEAGGPGMGGCPAGPGDVAAPTPGNGTYLLNAAGDSVRVDWTPATAAPGASPVTGYQVSVVGAASTDGSSTVTGKRTSATATNATIPVSPAAPGGTLNVEIRALTQDGQMSKTMTVAKAAPGGGTGAEPPAGPVGNGDGPVITATGTDPVTLIVPTGADVYYTTDGSPVHVADMPTDTATRYTAPIDITQPNTTINWVAFGGETVSEGTFGPFEPVVATGLAAPTGVTATPGANSATVTWNAVTGASKHIVTATPPTGSTSPAVTVEAGSAATTATLNNLTAAVDYSVTVTASTATTAGASSTPVTVRPTAPTTDRVTIASARWKAGDFRVEGSGTDPTAVLSIRIGSATAQPLTGAAVTWTPAATPGANATWSVRFRNGQPTTLPTAVYVTSDKGGKAGPFTAVRG
jgi:hypothetical protein